MTGRRFIVSFSEVFFISSPKSSTCNWKKEATDSYFNHNAVRSQFERETSPRSQHVFWIVIQMYGAFKQTFWRGCSNHC